MNDWLTIDGAPQDGMTKIIAGGWNVDYFKSTIIVCILERHDSDQGDKTRPRAIVGMGMMFYPTHYIPLPSPSPKAIA